MPTILGLGPVILVIYIVVALLLIALAAFIAFKMGVSYRKKIAEAEFGSAEAEAKEIVKRAEKEGENKKRELTGAVG